VPWLVTPPSPWSPWRWMGDGRRRGGGVLWSSAVSTHRPLPPPPPAVSQGAHRSQKALPRVHIRAETAAQCRGGTTPRGSAHGRLRRRRGSAHTQRGSAHGRLRRRRGSAHTQSASAHGRLRRHRGSAHTQRASAHGRLRRRSTRTQHCGGSSPQCTGSHKTPPPPNPFRVKERRCCPPRPPPPPPPSCHLPLSSAGASAHASRQAGWVGW
jgi:hypothetical protein